MTTQGTPSCAKSRCKDDADRLGLCAAHEEEAQNEQRYRRLAARATAGHPDLVGVRGVAERLLRKGSS